MPLSRFHAVPESFDSLGVSRPHLAEPLRALPRALLTPHRRVRRLRVLSSRRLRGHGRSGDTTRRLCEKSPADWIGGYVNERDILKLAALTSRQISHMIEEPTDFPI